MKFTSLLLVFTYFAVTGTTSALPVENAKRILGVCVLGVGLLGDCANSSSAAPSSLASSSAVSVSASASRASSSNASASISTGSFSAASASVISSSASVSASAAAASSASAASSLSASAAAASSKSASAVVASSVSASAAAASSLSASAAAASSASAASLLSVSAAAASSASAASSLSASAAAASPKSASAVVASSVSASAAAASSLSASAVAASSVSASIAAASSSSASAAAASSVSAASSLSASAAAASSLSASAAAAASATPTPVSPASANGYSYGGCVQEVSGRLLNKVQTSSSDMTVEKCTSICAGYGYQVAGVEYGDECYCGTYAQVQTSASSGQCYMTCAGNSFEFCGGPNAINYYYNPSIQAASVTLPSGWTTYGLVNEGTNGGRALPTTLWSRSDNTIESCAAGCAAAGFTISGTEYSSECYCGSGSFMNGGGALQNPNTAFTMSCSGNGAETCGGPSLLSIVTSQSGAIPTQ